MQLEILRLYLLAFNLKIEQAGGVLSDFLLRQCFFFQRAQQRIRLIFVGACLNFGFIRGCFTAGIADTAAVTGKLSWEKSANA